MIASIVVGGFGLVKMYIYEVTLCKVKALSYCNVIRYRFI